MPTLKDYENTDELHNPSTEQARRLNDLEDQTGKDAGVNAGIDQSESFANDPANSSKNIDDTREREQTANSQDSNPFGYQSSGGGSNKKAFAKILLKRGGPLGLAALIFGGAGLGLFFLSPGLLLVQIKEVFTNYGSDASRAAPVRYKKLMNYTLGNNKVDAACAKSPSSVKCKVGTFSEKQVKAYEDAGFKVRGDDFNGRTRITEIQFPDENDSKGGTKPGKVVKTGAEYDRELRRSASSASKALRAFNPGNNVFNGARFTSKVLAKWGQNKSKVTLTGDTEDDKKKDFSTKVGADKDNAALEEDFKEKNATKFESLKHVSIGARASGPAGVGCLLYNTERATLAGVKAYNAARYVTFAMLFLKVADQIKSQGDVDPGTVAALGAILTGYATSGPEKGLSATDSQGYKVAAYGGERRLASFTQRTLLGGNSEFITLDNTIKWMQDKVGKSSIRAACKTADSFLLGTALGTAMCAGEVGAATAAGTEIPGAGNFLGALGSTAACVGQFILMGVAVGKIVSKMLDHFIPMAVKALANAPIKSNISGVDAGNAIALGAGTLMDTTNASRGLAPGSKDQVTHFLASTQSSQDEYDKIASYDARDEPLNMYNEHSFLGSLVRKSGVLSLNNASLSGGVVSLGQLFQTVSAMPSTAMAASMPVSLKPGDLDNCPSSELQEAGFACNVLGQPKYMMTDQELNMDVDANLDYMISHTQVDEETGAPVTDSSYEKWTKYCTEQRDDLMGSSSLPIEDGDYDWSTGRNCGPLADFSGDNSQTDISNYVVYYNTLADKEDQDTEIASSAAPTGNGTSFRIASFNMKGASHTDGPHQNEPTTATSTWSARAPLSLNVVKSKNLEIVGFQEFEPVQRNFMQKGLPNYGMTKEGKNSDAIMWNKDRFSLEDEGTWLTTYFGGNTDEPWIRLKDKSSGQVFFVMNAHDPINRGQGDNEARYQNALAHAAQIKKLHPEAPVLLTGDFNSSYSNDAGAGAATDDKLTYCVLTSSGLVNDSYDLSVPRQAKCPNKPKGDPNFIDHIYLTPEIQVTSFGYVPGGPPHKYTSNGSDHPTIFSDVVIPGSGENVGTKGAITWPLDKKWWTSNKLDFLDAHGLTSSTFTSPTIAGWSSDISTPPDGSPIYSMLAGKVTASDSCRVIVESDISGGKLTIAYGHGNPSVKQGDTVSSGQKISSLAANCNATGGHLHVDMSLSGKHICPQDVFIAIGQDTNPDFAGLAKKYTGAPNGCGRV